MLNIYTILLSKFEEKEHYIQRYCNFIEYCKKTNINLVKKSKANPNGVYLECHHILPKAKDAFPEYSSFKEYPSNMIYLTARQHYIAHWILWKICGRSQIAAFFRMCNKGSGNQERIYLVNSKTYEKIREEFSKKVSKQMSENNPSTKESTKEKRRKQTHLQSPEVKRKAIETNKNKRMGKVNVMINETGIYALVPKEEYNNNKRLYTHPSKGKETSDRQKLAVSNSNKRRKNNIDGLLKHNEKIKIKCRIDGIEYDSISKAEKEFPNINIRYKLYSDKEKYKNYEILK
jgi:hypothetical protein